MPERLETEGEALNVPGALRTLERLEGFEVGLYRRTEGLTWMFWGLITAGIYFTYSTVGASYGDVPPSVWFEFLWAPWVAAGIAATVALWRSIHLAAQVPLGLRKGLRETLPWVSIYGLLFVLGFFLYARLGDDWTLREPGYVMVLLALASGIVAMATTCTRSARRMILTVAILALAAALALATVVPYADATALYMVQTLTGVAVLGGGWFLGGLWLTLRG
jgi:hypothetical protein